MSAIDDQTTYSQTQLLGLLKVRTELTEGHFVTQKAERVGREGAKHRSTADTWIMNNAI
jgi:hypothetical protein